MPYTKEDVERIAQAQRDAGWDEERIANYAQMQKEVWEEAFPTGKESVSYSDMDKIIRGAIGRLVVRESERLEKK